MKRPDVLYCVEHVARELSIACAVKYLAHERYGLDVEVISLAHPQHDVIKRYRPGLVAVPALFSRRGYGVNARLEQFRGVPLFNLAFEQLLSEANRKFRMPKDDVARKEVLHLAAGDFYQSWLETDGVPPENIVTVGSLPCQLYRPPYREFFAADRERIARTHRLDPDKPWVFFPENCFAAFLTKSHIRHRLRHGYDATALADYVAWSRDRFRQIMSWCVEAVALGRIELIVRPRPATSRQSFTESVLSTVGRLPEKHLHIIKEGDVRGWVLTSQIVISSFSTVLVEAAVAGKPTYLLKPCEIPASARSEWHAETQQITSREAFLDLMDNPHMSAPNQSLATWADKHLLAHGDAIENLARICAEIVTGKRAAPTLRHPGAMTITWDKLTDALKRGERFARATFRPKRRALFTHDGDEFGTDEVNATVERWGQIFSDVPSRGAA